MSLRKPPRLAVWLLAQTGIAAGNSPLIGDLLEDFHQGRTSGWFWRQALAAIFTAARRPELRPWLTAYGFQIVVTVVFLRIHGPVHIHASLKSVLALLLFWIIHTRFKPAGYWARVFILFAELIQQNWRFLAVLAMLGGDFGTPGSMIQMNVIGFLIDFWRVLKRDAPEVPSR